MTTSARCVKVAQPRPYRPGSVVSTFTITRFASCGAVPMAFTLLIFKDGKRLGISGGFSIPAALAEGIPPNAPKKPDAVPIPSAFSIERRLWVGKSFLLFIILFIESVRNQKRVRRKKYTVKKHIHV